MTGEVSGWPARGRGTRFRFLRFLVAAGLSVPVNLGSRVIFSLWMPFEWALLASHLCGMLTAYALTKVFVFEHSGAPAHVELTRFAAVNVVSAAITWIVAVGLVRFIFPIVGVAEPSLLLAHVIGLSVSSVASFFGHRDFSFRKHSRAHLATGSVHSAAGTSVPWMATLHFAVVSAAFLREIAYLQSIEGPVAIFEHGAYQRTVLAFNYFELGPIRRGLAGSIVHLLSPDILIGSTVFFFASALAVCLLTSRLFARPALPWPQQLAFLAVMAGIMLRWAEDICRTDMTIAALLSAATLAVLRGRIVVAVLFICIGVFVHELSFIFGLPLIAALLTRARFEAIGKRQKWATVLVLAVTVTLYLVLVESQTVDVPTMVRIVRSKFEPSEQGDWAIFIAVSGARGLALNLCQNRVDPAYPIHVIGGLLVIACTVWAIGSPIRRKWALASVVAIAPFVFLTVVANDIGRWAVLACFNVWLVAASVDGTARAPERARIWPLGASMALLLLLQSFDRGGDIVHKPSPLLEAAARRLANKYTMGFDEVLQRCDPTWRDLLTNGPH